MNTNIDSVRVAIADGSVVIRSGLAAALRHLSNIKVQTLEAVSAHALADCMRIQHPDVLIVNPYFCQFFDIDEFRSRYSQAGVHVVALVSGFVDPLLLAKYDAVLSVFDDLETIGGKLAALREKEEDETTDDGQEVLSQREKEIVVCVVKGLTNKEIAEQLFLSIHTVVTHRKNISKKLQIHSVSGLTIYAIVNKLVELSEINSL